MKHVHPILRVAFCLQHSFAAWICHQHSPVKDHLGCSQLFPNTNSDTMNFLLLVSLNTCLRASLQNKCRYKIVGFQHHHHHCQRSSNCSPKCFYTNSFSHQQWVRFSIWPHLHQVLGITKHVSFGWRVHFIGEADLYFLAVPHRSWDLSSLTRDQTRTLGSESTESLDSQGIPRGWTSFNLVGF